MKANNCSKKSQWYQYKSTTSKTFTAGADPHHAGRWSPPDTWIMETAVRERSQVQNRCRMWEWSWGNQRSKRNEAGNNFNGHQHVAGQRFRCHWKNIIPLSSNQDYRNLNKQSPWLCQAYHETGSKRLCLQRFLLWRTDKCNYKSSPGKWIRLPRN